MINKQQVKINQYWKYLGSDSFLIWPKSYKISSFNGRLEAIFNFEWEKRPLVYGVTVHAMILKVIHEKITPLNSDKWQLTGIPCNKCNQYCFQDCKNG